MTATIATFASLTAPLFAMVALGYLLVRGFRWPAAVHDALARFVFSVAIPALLFRLMSDFSKLPPVDLRVLAAYFGACLAVFVLARAVSHWGFRHDGATQSVFALGGIFSNNVLLGVPLVQATMAPSAGPVLSLVLVFNALVLWTLVSVSVEWARARSLKPGRFLATAKGVLVNPIIAGILAGTAFGYTGLSLPGPVDRSIALLAQAAVPLSLIALGMGLAQYPLAAEWRASVAIAAIKLVALPAAAWGLARLVGLDATTTAVVVVLAGLPVGANVYLMARHFRVLEGPIAASLVLSTALAALTTPLLLALAGAPPPPAP